VYAVRRHARRVRARRGAVGRVRPEVAHGVHAARAQPRALHEAERERRGARERVQEHDHCPVLRGPGPVLRGVRGVARPVRLCAGVSAGGAERRRGHGRCSPSGRARCSRRAPSPG
jgi:hypothetical protein